MDKLFSNIQQSLQQNKQNTLLQNQQISQDKINKLLDTSGTTLLSSPTYQKLKVTGELKQKYLDAKTNVKTAPIELEQSKKNYYVFTEGKTSYNNMLETELNKKVEEIAKLVSENFNNEISNASTMNEYLNTALINSLNTEDLLNEYIKQNKELKLKLRNNSGDILTNDRKTFYETQEFERLQLWYKFWWYIYYMLFITFLFWCILTPSDFSRVFKLILAILFLFYPYYIDYVLRSIYDFITSVHKNSPKNVYNEL